MKLKLTSFLLSFFFFFIFGFVNTSQANAATLGTTTTVDTNGINLIQTRYCKQINSPSPITIKSINAYNTWSAINPTDTTGFALYKDDGQQYVRVYETSGVPVVNGWNSQNVNVNVTGNFLACIGQDAGTPGFILARNDALLPVVFLPDPYYFDLIFPYNYVGNSYDASIYVTADARLLGNDSGDPNNWYSGGYNTYTQYTATQSGTVNELHTVAGSSCQAKFAIYSDNNGHPDALLNSTNSVSLSTGSNTIPFPSTVVAQGTPYWLGFYSDVNDCVRDDDNGNNSVYYVLSDGTFPATVEVIEGQHLNRATLIALYDTAFNITPTPTPTATPTPTTTPTPSPVTVTFNASGDTHVRSGQGNHNYGGVPFMRVQSSGDNRGLVRFDQSALQSSISGTVLSAKLRLTITDNGNNWGSTGRTVDVHRISADWLEGNGTESSNGTDSGATWNCAIDSIISNTAKNCSGSTEWEMGQPNNASAHPWVQTATDSKTISNGQTGIVEYNVTADVQAFMNGTNNYGWIIKKTNEGQNGTASFGTKESTSKPQLVVTYQP